MQDPFVNMLRRDKVPVSIHLIDGTKLQGCIEAFDRAVILLRSAAEGDAGAAEPDAEGDAGREARHLQMVYKQGIMSIEPNQMVHFEVPYGGVRSWQGHDGDSGGDHQQGNYAGGGQRRDFYGNRRGGGGGGGGGGGYRRQGGGGGPGAQRPRGPMRGGGGGGRPYQSGNRDDSYNSGYSDDA